MRAIKFLPALFVLPLAAACNFSFSDHDDTPGVAATGSGTTRSYAIADFDEVALAGGDDVDVRVGTGFSVRAEGAEAGFEKLRIRKSGKTLTIDRRRGSWSNNEKMKVYVTLPRLTEASIAGSGDMTVDRVEAASFAGNVAGSGTLSINGAQTEKMDLSSAGSGDIRAAGTTGKLTMNSAGSGDIDAAGLTATSADVSIAGSGNARAVVNGAATVNVLGSGDVDLGPKATCKTHKMGSGEVRCGGGTS